MKPENGKNVFLMRQGDRALRIGGEELQFIAGVSENCNFYPLLRQGLRLMQSLPLDLNPCCVTRTTREPNPYLLSDLEQLCGYDRRDPRLLLRGGRERKLTPP